MDSLSKSANPNFLEPSGNAGEMGCFSHYNGKRDEGLKTKVGPCISRLGRYAGYV